MQKVFLLFLVCMGVTNLMAWKAVAQTAATIEIVKPLDRRNVPDKNAQVSVQITGVASNGGHYWELWVDEEPVAGARNGELAVTVSFKPTGPHRLKAVLFDAQGKQIAVSKGVLVLAAPVQERTPQFNRELMAPILGVFAVVTALLIVVSVWLNRRSRAMKRASMETDIV